VLASGLCDAADCSGSFVEGFLAGVGAGALFGGATGWVVGAALPADGTRASGWGLAAHAGYRRAWVGSGPVDGGSAQGGIRVLRATTPTTWVGLDAGWLGRAQETESFTVSLRDGGVEPRVIRRRWVLSSIGLVAVHALDGRLEDAGPWIGAGTGLYPFWETVHHDSAPTTGPFGPTGPEHSFLPLPGVSLEGGVSPPAVGTLTLDLRARLDVIGGLGDRAFAPLLRVDLGVGWRGP
jgi:hypothetical protein